MNKSYCQSCGMPIGAKEEDYGTEKDGSKNLDYCVYCFKDGAFTQELSMEQMIEACIPHVISEFTSMSETDARKLLQGQYPILKRWQKN